MRRALNPPGHCPPRPPWLGPGGLQGGREEKLVGAIHGQGFIDLFPSFGAVWEIDWLMRYFCSSLMTREGVRKKEGGGCQPSLGAEGSYHKTTNVPSGSQD